MIASRRRRRRGCASGLSSFISRMKKNEYEKRITVGATGDVGYGDLSPHLSLDIRMGCGARTDREVAHYRVKMLMNIFLPQIVRIITDIYSLHPCTFVSVSGFNDNEDRANTLVLFLS